MQWSDMPINQITVSIGGGRELERAGLTALVANLPGLRVVSIEKDPAPQVFLWVNCPVTGELPSVSPDTKIVLLTEHVADETLPETVTGLFSRDESVSALGIAIRQVARGEQYLSPSLATALFQKRAEKTLVTDLELSRIKGLTEREREILDLLAQGLSNKLIASKLYLSVRTVEGHLANIYQRLRVHSRTEAMLMAVRVR
jgi:DNA-binding NarL/FixJ family response regulator